MQRWVCTSKVNDGWGSALRMKHIVTLSPSFRQCLRHSSNGRCGQILHDGHKCIHRQLYFSQQQQQQLLSGLLLLLLLVDCSYLKMMLGARLHRCTIATAVVECHRHSYIAEAAIRGRHNQTMLTDWITRACVCQRNLSSFILVYKSVGPISRSFVRELKLSKGSIEIQTVCLVTSGTRRRSILCFFYHRFSKNKTISLKAHNSWISSCSATRPTNTKTTTNSQS